MVYRNISKLKQGYRTRKIAKLKRRIKAFSFCDVGGASVDKNPCYSGTDYSGTTQSPPLKPQL